MNFRVLAAVCLMGATTQVGCKSASEKQSAPVAAEYKMLDIGSSDCQVSSSYSASIRGRQDIEIKPQISGKLTKVLVKEGESVESGEVLFVIDQVPYKAALATAEASVAVAKSNLATAKLTFDSKSELFKAKVISEYEYNTAMNAMLTAEANLASAEATKVSAVNDLSYTEVKSPSKGVTGTIPHRVGAYVSPSMGDALTTVSDNSVMYVYFSIAENELLSLIRENGTKQEAIKNFPELGLMLSDRSTYETKGKLSTISGVIDQSTGAVSLRAEFANPKGLLHSGATGNVIITRSRKGAMVIPQAATFELQNKTFVYKVIDEKACSSAVEIEKVNGGTTYIVTSGLELGDVIIAEGAGLVREGTAVARAKSNSTDNKTEK